RHEAMAARGVAGGDAVHLERHDVGRLRLRTERADDGMQRTHPGQAPGLSRACAPTHRLRPRERTYDAGQQLGQYLAGWAAGLAQRCHIELSPPVLTNERLVDR